MRTLGRDGPGRGRSGLAKRFGFAVVFGLAMTGAIAAAAAAGAIYRAEATRERARLVQAAESTRVSLASALWSLDTELINSTLDGYARIGIGAHLISKEIDRRVGPAGGAAAHAITLVHTPGTGEPFIVGQLELSSDFKTVREAALSVGLVVTSVVFAASFAGGALVTVMFDRIVGRDLRRLADLVDAAVPTDPGSVPAPIEIKRKGNDEIGALERALARSTERLGATLAALAEEREGLERRVVERTAELEATRAELVESGKQAALGALVAGVAHEINTPLGVSYTATSLLADETTRLLAAYEREEVTQEDFEAFMQTAQRTTKVTAENLGRAAELVRSFKMVAVDQAHTDRERVTVIPYLKDALLSLVHELKLGRIALDISGDAHAAIEIPPTHLWQIASNLVLNAKVHAFEGVSDRRVRIEVALDGDRVLIDVIDNGVGMSDTVKARCFDPFYTTKRGSGGSGLGLSVVHSLVSGLGGRITVQSGPDQGTAFRIDLPSA